MLAIVLQMSEEQVHAALWPAVRQDQIERRDGSYKFMHDRVQEAAYSLIPEALRAEVHLRIGQAAGGADANGGAGGGDLRHRQSAQPRRGADHPARGTGAVGRIQLDRGQARQGLYCVCLGSRLSQCSARRCWWRIAGSAGMGSIFALELNRAECEFLTGQPIGRGGAIGGAVKSRCNDDRTGLHRVHALRCLPHPGSE